LNGVSVYLCRSSTDLHGLDKPVAARLINQT